MRLCKACGGAVVCAKLFLGLRLCLGECSLLTTISQADRGGSTIGNYACCIESLFPHPVLKPTIVIVRTIISVRVVVVIIVVIGVMVVLTRIIANKDVNNNGK